MNIARITSWLEANHRRIDLLLICAALFVFILGLKPFHLGLWFQSEPVTLGLFILAIGAGFFFIFSYHTKGAVFVALWNQPVMQLVLALVAWSCISALFSSFPMRSVLGAPEIGESILSLVALLMLTAVAYAAWQKITNRRLLAMVAVIASIAVVALQRISSTIDWQPAKWPDFMAFIGLFLTIILLAYPVVVTRKHLIFSAVSGAILLIASGSLAARLTILILAFVALGIGWARRELVDEQKLIYRARQCFIGLSLLPLLITLISFRIDFVRDIADQVGNLSGFDILTSASFNESSIGTRVLFNNAGLDAILDKPWLLLVGNGWGSFSDVLFNHVFTDGVKLYNDNAIWSPNWFMITGSAFHSHNAFMEVLLSTGIIGLLLLCCIPVVIIRHLPADRVLILGPLWASVFLLSGFWFMLPVALPFMALALAASIPAPTSFVSPASTNQNPPERKKIQLLCGVIIVALTVGSWVQHSTAASAARLMSAIQARLPEPGDDAMLRDHGRGNNHLWWIALNMSQYINTKIAQGEPVKADDVIWFKEILGLVQKTVESETANDRLHGQYAVMHSDLIVQYQSPLWNSLRTERLPQWESVLDKTIEKSPARGDIALIYYTFFLENMQRTTKHEIAESYGKQLMLLADAVLKNNPDDPTALWFSGLTMLRTTETNKLGLQRLFKAVDLKAERLVPINDEVRKAVEKERQR